MKRNLPKRPVPARSVGEDWSSRRAREEPEFAAMVKGIVERVHGVHYPRRTRQMQILQRAAKFGRVRLHCEGGRGYNKDCRDLVARKLMKFERVAYGKGFGGNYDLRRSQLVLTEKGRKALESGRITV